MPASSPPSECAGDAPDTSEEEDRPEAAGRVLGETLRRLRKERGFGLKDVAPVIRSSVSKISRLERAESPPKPRDVEDLVRFYGVSAEEQREIDTLLQQTQSSAWWDQYTDVTPSWLRRLIDLESAADTLRIYETHLVPGLLQTPAYARAVVKGGLPAASESEIARRVKLREHRQRLLRGGQRPRVMALLDEGVLHRPTGGAAVMAEQLRHLQALDTTPGIGVRVLRFREGVGVAPSYPFTHLHFRDGGPAEMVYVENMASASYATKRSDVESYRQAWHRACAKCARWEDSMGLLERWAGIYEKEAGVST